MKTKFNSALQAGIEEEQKSDKHQEKLKKKFGLTGKQVVIVEKNNFLKFSVHTVVGLIRFLATVALLALALLGLITLFYEGPRRELFHVLHEAWKVVQETVPIEKLVR